MNCRRAMPKLSQYLDGDLPGRERAAIAAHLETCARCRAEAAALRRAEGALEALAAVERAPDLTDDLHRRLAVPAPGPLRAAGVGAAVLAVAAAAGFLLWSSPRAPAPEPAPKPVGIGVPQVRDEPGEATPVTQERRERTAAGERQEAPPRIVRKANKITPVRVEEEPEGVPRAEETVAATPELVPVEATVGRYGIILLLGEARPVLPSSKCYVEVSFPNGVKSILDQSVERDAAGEPRAVQISYQQIAPEGAIASEGG